MMKKLILITGLLFTPILTTAETNNLEQRVLKLEQHVDQLQQQLDTLKSQFNSLTQVTSASSTTSPPVLTSASSTQLTLVKWSFRYVPIKFDTFYALDIELHNGFTKAITEIEARIDFRDLLGELFYSTNITSNLDIPPGQTITDQGNRRNKRLLGRGHQIVSMEAKDIKAELVVDKLVFDDGTVLSF